MSGSAPILFALTCFMIWNVQVLGVDECTAGLKSCPSNSMCSDQDVNTNGTATCTCKSGFTGNETLCEDINECNVPSPCPGEGFQCENTRGSFSCFCKRNYEMINATCVDKNECAKEDTYNCHKDAVCIDIGGGGGYNCSCKTGFAGDGKTNCTDIDECQGTQNCHSNATCENVPGSYVCNCKITVATGTSCQVSSYCPTSAPVPKDDDDDSCTVIILVSITIVLLIVCLIVLVTAIYCVYKMKKHQRL